ncbi:hypothetical protein ACIRJR_09450 [Streptomyces sp. NPDC102402]|uniref:hypothetical protein n=1 Tax=Streptomyces sp. NPDC102402 TaxID=3366169 RepID=UPI003821E3BE
MNTTQTIGASLAGCTIAIVILLFTLRTWWTGGRALKDLVIPVQGFLTGGLATICVGGLAGWLSGCAVQVVSGAGGTAISSTTGTDAGAPIATGSLGRLTEEGGVVTFVVFLALIASYKAAPKADKGRLLGCLAAGMVLCVTAGIAGALDGLPGLINEAGSAARGLLERQL